MRIKIKKYRDNQTRIRKKFIIFPTRINDEIVFLENIITIERYNTFNNVWSVEKSVNEDYDIDKLKQVYFNKDIDLEEDWRV